MANLKLDKRSEDKLVNFINDVVIPLLEKNKTDSETIQKVNKIAFLFKTSDLSDKFYFFTFRLQKSILMLN